MEQATVTESAIDLKPFCGEDGRYNFGKPFNQDGHYCASDGKILIRIPNPGIPDTPDIKVPKVNSLRWPDTENAVMHPWSPAEYRFTKQVLATGKDEDGDDTDTIGWMPEPRSIMLAAQRINSEYHYLISQLPNVKYLPGVRPLDPIFFTFDGGDGLLMPMNPE